MDFRKEFSGSKDYETTIPTFLFDLIQLDISLPTDGAMSVYVKTENNPKEKYYVYNEELEKIDEIVESGVYVLYAKDMEEFSIKNENHSSNKVFIEMSYIA